MDRIHSSIIMIALLISVLVSCSTENLQSTQSGTDLATSKLIDVAQTAGQLASGTVFSISGSSTDSTSTDQPHHPGGHDGHHHGPPVLDGISLLAPTDQLLAIVDAESASDFRGMRISKNGGATVTHFDANGNTVVISPPSADGPQGCSFSGKQFPGYDSLLTTIVKTEIDFGSGVTFKHDTVTITRSGKIIITRSGNTSKLTEVTTFENYVVNGIHIEGTKTRVSTFDKTTGSGSSVTSVSDGKFTFADGTTATWTSDKTRTSTITLDSSTNRPVSGTIVTEVSTTVTATSGVVIYSHRTTTPLTEDIACRRRHSPISGALETIYGSDTIIVDFGSGSCDNQTVSVTINGVTTTKTIGE